MAKLLTLRGSDFVGQLKLIAARKEFHPLVSDPCIFTVGGEQNDDYTSLLLAARKVVEHGYRVYLLPNPHDFRTADFILERRGVYKLYVSITRDLTLSPDFYNIFMRRYLR